MQLLENTIFINLETRKDRLEHVKQELAKIGVNNPERFNAIRLKSGAIGCSMSHIKCIELAKSRGYEQVFICEDDITFTNPTLLIENLTKFAKNEDINWDMCLIGANNVPPFMKVTDYCIRVFYAQTTTGYIIKKHYYDTLIKNIKEGLHLLMKSPNMGQLYAIDMYWKRLQLQDWWYMIIPPTVKQYENYSDIENRCTNYDHLMLDLDKQFLFKRPERTPTMSLQL
jgi:GR25 family glycosyltransferase involved in LPS biosynthesis